MDIGAQFVLPADVAVIPARDLPEGALAGVEWESGDWTVTRPRSRTPTRVVSSDLAALLILFRESRTIVDAVIDFSVKAGRDPEVVLEEAVPALGWFIGSRWLVPPGSPAAGRLEQTLRPGAVVGRFEIVECRHILEDTEVYAARTADGAVVALKIARPFASESIERLFLHEARILAHLDGTPAPRLIDSRIHGSERFLAMEWCQGVPATVAAAEFSAAPSRTSRRRLKSIGANILHAYETLHRRGVLHGDIHPGNILVDSDSVRLVDFGHASLVGDGAAGRNRRTGVPSFFDPALAAARRLRRPPPPADTRSEQYCLASLLYLLLAGRKYLEFSNDKLIALAQVSEAPMLPFAAQGVPPWPDAERVLARALSKNPEDRFESIADLQREWRTVEVVAPPRIPQRGRGRRGIDPYINLALSRLRAHDDDDVSSSIPSASVTFGAAGAAYALYRLAQIREDPAFLVEADLSIARAAVLADRTGAFHSADLDITEKTVGTTSPYHNRSGIHVVAALIGRARGDFVAVAESVRGFVVESQRPCSRLDLTVGVAGTLVGSALLLESIRAIPSHFGFDPEHEQVIRRLGNATLHTIWRALDGFPEIAACNELDNSGIAHGWAGLCYASLMWCRISASPIPTSLESRLDQLASVAEPVGRGIRWPVHSAARSKDDRRYLASWCNGAPGQIHLWYLAERMLHQSRYGEIAQQCAWNSWEDREPTSSLCCGFAGRAYALLAAYRASGDDLWLARAREIASHARAIPSYPLMPNSLYKGELGIALLTAELTRPAEAIVPFFELEGLVAAP